MSKLAILKSDTQKVISEQELSINKPNIDDDIIDKKIIETKTNIGDNFDKDNKPNIDDSDKTPFETKDKINNKLNFINKINTRLAKANTEITNKIKLIYKAKSELRDDSWLGLVKLNKMDAILDDATNVVRYEIYGKKERAQK